MAAPDLRQHDYPIGPYRDKRAVAIGADDFERKTGFTCQVATDGNLTYETLHGDAEITEENLSAGDTITGPGGIPVLLRKISGSSTVTSVVIGIV